MTGNHDTNMSKTERVEATALLIKEVGELTPGERAKLYLQVLARLSQSFQITYDGESRAAMKFVENLMAQAGIGFTVCPDIQVTPEVRAKLHPFQQSAGAFYLIDRLFKAQLTYLDTASEMKGLLKDIEVRDKEIARIYQEEHQVPMLIRWIRHYSNLPELDFLGNQIDQAKIRLLDAKQQLHCSIRAMHNCLAEVVDKRYMVVTLRSHEQYPDVQEFLTWAGKHNSWACDTFYDLPDAKLGLILRRSVITEPS